MPCGYHGKILRVNLTTGELDVERPDESFYREYMGGSALGLSYLLKEMPAGVDPLGPDNVMVVSLSVLTGAPISGQSRMTINARSPLTGAIGDSQAGGFWPAELKRAGFDAIIITGTGFSRETLDAALDTYYRLAGWDVETGNPTRPTLESLGLDWVADQLGL